MTNQFAEIHNYEGRYLISRDGDVISLYDNFGNLRHTPKQLKPLKRGHTGNQYYAVNLYKDKVSRMFSIHRLVAEAFIPNPEGLPIVNHKDENTFNNMVDNLEWCTSQYNQEYSLSKRVYEFQSPDGEFIQIKNLRKFSRENNLNHAHMYGVANGKILRYRGWSRALKNNSTHNP